jgi:hypothetical protein
LTLFNQKAADVSNGNFQVKSMTANLPRCTLTITQISDGSVDRNLKVSDVFVPDNLTHHTILQSVNHP